MGKQEFARMLEGIVNDADTAERVAGGDFADLAKGELTDAEQALLTAAAGDLDGDVSGFAIDAFLKLGDIDGESWKVISPHVKIEWSPNVRQAFKYMKIGD
nr:hypothetical protein [uncultured bacterium]